MKRARVARSAIPLLASLPLAAACGAFSADEPAATPDASTNAADGAVSLDGAPGEDAATGCSTTTCATDAATCLTPPLTPRGWTLLTTPPATISDEGGSIHAKAEPGMQALYSFSFATQSPKAGFVLETDLRVVAGQTFDLARFVIAGTGSVFLRVTPTGVVVCQDGATQPSCSDPPIALPAGTQRVRWTAVDSQGNIKMAVQVGCSGAARSLTVTPATNPIGSFQIGIDSATATTDVKLANTHLALY